MIGYRVSIGYKRVYVFFTNDANDCVYCAIVEELYSVDDLPKQAIQAASKLELTVDECAAALSIARDELIDCGYITDA